MENLRRKKKITVRCVSSVRSKGIWDTYIGRSSEGGVGDVEVFQSDRKKNRGTDVHPDNVD